MASGFDRFERPNYMEYDRRDWPATKTKEKSIAKERTEDSETRK